MNCYRQLFINLHSYPLPSIVQMAFLQKANNVLVLNISCLELLSIYVCIWLCGTVIIKYSIILWEEKVRWAVVTLTDLCWTHNMFSCTGISVCTGTCSYNLHTNCAFFCLPAVWAHLSAETVNKGKSMWWWICVVSGGMESCSKTLLGLLGLDCSLISTSAV